MKYIVKEYLAAPGLHNWPSADLIIAPDHEVDQAIAAHERTAGHFGETIIGFRVYDEANRAQDLVNAINSDKAKSLAEWRQAVYGEIIPVCS